MPGDRLARLHGEIRLALCRCELTELGEKHGNVAGSPHVPRRLPRLADGTNVDTFPQEIDGAAMFTERVRPAPRPQVRIGLHPLVAKTLGDRDHVVREIRHRSRVFGEQTADMAHVQSRPAQPVTVPEGLRERLGLVEMVEEWPELVEWEECHVELKSQIDGHLTGPLGFAKVLERVQRLLKVC